MTAILDRYIYKELIPPFFFGIAMFTILFMATGPVFDMANLVIKFGVPILLVLKYAIVRIPSFIAFTIPMSVLLATLVAFGRLSVDHEMIAMKAGGISFYRILIPVFLFSLAATLICYLLNEKIGPESLYKARTIVSSREAQGHLPPLENIKFSSKTEDGLERITIARSFNEEDGIMHSPVINDYGQNGDLVRITHAERAVWKDNAWTLVNGESFQFDPKGVFQTRITFSKAEVHMQDPRQVSLLERSPDEMDNNLLRKTILVMEKDPSRDREQIRSLWVRFRIREALPFACLVFALVGAPSGIRPLRSTSSAGVAMSVFIILIYYFFVAVCKSLGEGGELPATLAAWMPNILFLILAGVFLVKEST